MAEGAKGEVVVEEPTRAQQTLARRVAEAKATVPDFALSAGVDVDGLDLVLERIVRACALALREHPRANGAYRDGRFERYSRVNVGVVIGVADGLVVPTIFDADRKPLAEIASELAVLAQRADGGELTPPELAGGTFTVFPAAAERITPVINGPQAAILGVGAAVPRAVARDAAVAVRSVAELTLVCDHRILYGDAAAALLERVRALVRE